MTPLLTLRQASKVSGIGYAILRKIVAAKRLPVVRLPERKFVLIDPSDLGRLIEASKTGAEPGSNEKPHRGKVVDISAQKKRSQAAESKASGTGKYQWIDKYRELDAR